MRTTESAIDAVQTPAESTSPDYLRSLVRPPVLSSAGHGWQHVSLYRCQVPSFNAKQASLCVHGVTVHLTGPILIERISERGRDRVWSERGCTSFVPAGVPVTRSFTGQADYIVMFLAPAIMDEVAADAFGLDPARVQLVESLAVPDERLAGFGHLLLAEAEAGGASTVLFADTLTRALALHLLRAYSAQSPRAPAPPGALVGWRLRRAVEHMHANLSDDLSLARLAAEAGLSPSHFARAFRTATGEPPHRYLIRLRVEKARHLLEHTRLPVIEVGLRCGFEQTTHFATMFRKTTGLSPRAYRAARCT